LLFVGASLVVVELGEQILIGFVVVESTAGGSIAIESQRRVDGRRITPIKL
jgi:hypothetical protein